MHTNYLDEKEKVTQQTGINRVMAAQIDTNMIEHFFFK